MIEQTSDEALSTGCAEELECNICYHPYNLGRRRPKVLECCHRMCAKCLSKMAGLAEATPHSVACPFCRWPTSLRRELVGGLPDDSNIVTALALRGRNRKKPNSGSAELLLSPESLAPAISPTSSSSAASSSSVHGSSDCLVFTVMEAQELLDHHNSSHTPVRDSPTPRPEPWRVWRFFPKMCWFLSRMTVWFLGLLYFTSIALGVYLLVMKRTVLGIFLVSLIPFSLVMCKVYDFCQYFCREYCCCHPVSSIFVP